MNIYEVIRRPVITEKSTAQKEVDNQVVFEVDKRADKGQIRAAVEKLFNVKVKSVRTHHRPSKPKRFGRVFGRSSSSKRAIVTLHEGEELDFFEATAEFEEGVEV